MLYHQLIRTEKLLVFKRICQRKIDNTFEKSSIVQSLARTNNESFQVKDTLNNKHNL